MNLLLIRVNVMALGMNSVDKDLGVASAFLGGFRMAISAIATFGLSYFLVDSALPMMIAITGLTILSLLLQLAIKKEMI